MKSGGLYMCAVLCIAGAEVLRVLRHPINTCCGGASMLGVEGIGEADGGPV